MQSVFQRFSKFPFASSILALAATAATALPAQAAEFTNFRMVRSPALNAVPGCAPNATATVKISSKGATEIMTVEANGLPPNTDFDFFVIQVPNAPFGMAWYQ